ncbi:29448_t:CDS:2, partial [Racocetra persica]
NTSLSSNITTLTKNKKTYVVTPYFIKKLDDDSLVTCIICKNSFSKKIATGTLRKHLDTQHPGWNTIEIFAFTQMIVSDTLPFSIVGSKALITLLKFLNATLELLSRETIKSIVHNSFISMRGDVQTLFEQISGQISIILDFWTFHANMPFLGVTAHWINKDWNLKKILVDMCILPHPHTDFKEIEQSVGKVYTSMPMMIAAVMRCHSNLVYYRLSQEEDSDLQAVIWFLQPFYEITNILSGSTYVILGLSALLIDDIIDVILSYIQDLSSPQFLKTAATQMMEKLNQYINHIYDKAAIMASILDFQIKLELMLVNMNTPENQDYFSQIFQKYLESGLNNSPTNTTSNSEKVLNSMTYVKKVAQKRYQLNVLNSPMDELTKYLNEATLPININPLEWWKLNSFHFLVMSRMAKDFLAIQVISVPSEQIFSKAGDTIQAKRACLSEKSIQSLMCTGSWLEH